MIIIYGAADIRPLLSPSPSHFLPLPMQNNPFGSSFARHSKYSNSLPPSFPPILPPSLLTWYTPDSPSLATMCFTPPTNSMFKWMSLVLTVSTGVTTKILSMVPEGGKEGGRKGESKSE